MNTLNDILSFGNDISSIGNVSDDDNNSNSNSNSSNNSNNTIDTLINIGTIENAINTVPLANVASNHIPSILPNTILNNYDNPNTINNIIPSYPSTLTSNSQSSYDGLAPSSLTSNIYGPTNCNFIPDNYYYINNKNNNNTNDILSVSNGRFLDDLVNKFREYGSNKLDLIDDITYSTLDSTINTFASKIKKLISELDNSNDLSFNSVEDLDSDDDDTDSTFELVDLNKMEKDIDNCLKLIKKIFSNVNRDRFKQIDDTLNSIDECIGDIKSIYELMDINKHRIELLNSINKEDKDKILEEDRDRIKLLTTVVNNNFIKLKPSIKSLSLWVKKIGLQQSLHNKLVSMATEHKYLCPICYTKDIELTLSSCGHCFCDDCLTKVKPQYCPYCRKSFHKGTIVKLRF